MELLLNHRVWFLLACGFFATIRIGHAQRVSPKTIDCAALLKTDSAIPGKIAACDSSVALQRPDCPTLFAYGRALQHGGDHVDAVSVIREVLHDCPDYVRPGAWFLWQEIGVLYARAALRDAFPPERDSTDADALFASVMPDSSWFEARAILDTVLRETPRSRLGLSSLFTVLAKKEPRADRTLRVARDVLTIEPPFDWTTYFEIAPIADSAGDSNLSLQAQLRELDVEPRDTRIGTGASSWSEFIFDSDNLAAKLDSLGRRTDAEEIARRALEQDLRGDDFGHAINLTLLLGRTAYSEELPSFALIEVEELMRRYPRNQDLARALYLSNLMNQPVNVRIAFWRWYSDSTRLMNMRPGAYEQLAVALIEADRNEEASRAAWRGITLSPVFPFAWGTYATALYNTHRYTEAVGAWERALLQDPSYFDSNAEEAKAWQEAIETVGHRPPTPLPGGAR